MNLTEFPDEIICLLLNRLNSVTDLVNLSNTCTKLNELVLLDPYFIANRKLYRLTKYYDNRDSTIHTLSVYYTPKRVKKKLTFQENLLLNVCRYFKKGVNSYNQTYSRILSMLLNENIYDMDEINRATSICLMTGKLQPIKIFLEYNLYAMEDSILCDSDVLIDYFCNSLIHGYHDVAQWMLRELPLCDVIKSNMPNGTINVDLINELIIHNKIDSIIFLLKLKKKFKLPIISYVDVVDYLFVKCLVTTSPNHYKIMEELYINVQSDIPNQSVRANKGFVIWLCEIGYTNYLVFIFGIIVKHKMLSIDEIILLAQECFITSCEYGHIETAQKIFENFTEVPNMYNITVCFTTCFRPAFNKCIECATKAYDSIIHDYRIDLIKWLHQISRSHGNSPINITCDDIKNANTSYQHSMACDEEDRYWKETYSCDMVPILEQLVVENIYD